MKRYEHIDALRGLALFGIMFGNVTWFSGTAVMTSSARAALGSETLDDVTRWLVHVFVDGKFYSMFAMLFGVGFGLVMQRDAMSGPRFRRRMFVLLLIGGLHAVLLWFGDIVSLYAAVGLALPWFWRLSDRAMLRSAIGLMLAPIAWSALTLAVYDTGAGADPGHGPAALFSAFATGSYGELFAANWAFLEERWVLAIYSGRFFKLLGLFLLGAWLVRRGVAQDPLAHRRFLRRVLVVCSVIAIPTNVALAWFLTNVPERPPSLLGCARMSVQAVAAPVLCFVYASSLALLWSKASPLRTVLARVGRMSFTHYLAQSVVGAMLFYGIGYGMWGSFGDTVVAASLPILFAAQMAISVVWLQLWSAGPVESVVRRLSRLSGPRGERRRHHGTTAGT